LGYPKTPAKTPERGQHIHAVSFDRIAIWLDDFEGPEFRLKHKFAETGAMSMRAAEAKELLHYGVKGMKWGRRKDEGSATTPTSQSQISPKTGKAEVKTAGGERQPAHVDALSAGTKKQQFTKSGVSSLSNKDLRELANRIDLEQRVTRLATPPPHPAKKFIKTLLGNTADQQAKSVANQVATKQVNAMLKAKGLI